MVDRTNTYEFLIPIAFNLGGSYKFNDKLYFEGVPLIVITAIGADSKKPRADNLSSPISNISINFGHTSDPTYKSLSGALNKPKATKRLSLVNTALDFFPADVLKLINLEFLDLEKNHLKVLPLEIGNLTKLQELYLFDNKIESLPNTLRNLKELKILGLASNQLKSFPEEITLLEKLETLDLSDNQLSSIPPNIKSLKNLKLLVLQNNKVDKIPSELYMLKKLEKVYLQGNPISTEDIELLKKSFKKIEVIF